MTFSDNGFYDEHSMKVLFVKTLNLEIFERRNSLRANNSSHTARSQLACTDARYIGHTRTQVFTPYPAVPSDLELGLRRDLHSYSARLRLIGKIDL